VHPELSIVVEYGNSLNVQVSDYALDRLDRYLDLLLEWGSRLNLVGSTNARTIALDHFCDAVAVVGHIVIPDGARVIDVGTGAGLPGIPIALIRPDIALTLVDAMRKRIAFLEHTRNELSSNWDIVWGRAEVVSRDIKYRGGYDVAIERAVAPLERSAGLVLPFVSERGLAIFMKGLAVLDTGIGRGQNRSAICHLGGSIENMHSYSLPSTPGKVRTLVSVRKHFSPDPR
jgi:16S rRNA (guanine527-N7)-methyltransferase